EAAAEIDAIDYMIVGIGINVNTPPGIFPADLRGRATSLAAGFGRPVSRVDVLGDLLERFEREYDRAGREGFGPVIRRWRELSDMAGRRVRVHSFGRPLEGVITGIGDDGMLLLKTADGDVERIIAGDVEYI
ncbi:MAG TPA: hypothetical protein PLK84_04345, partial [Syntrophales bacterium]|nr:hypothetical protein [Syntrophales bacterium]